MECAEKNRLIETVIRQLEGAFDRQVRANAQANAASAQSAAGAEKQRDTTGFESAFLAHGYARHGRDLARWIDALRALPLEDFSGQEIDLGALVEVEFAGEVEAYLVLGCGGGIELASSGRRVTVVTPESPLGRALIGNFEAGLVVLPSGGEGIIVSVS